MCTGYTSQEVRTDGTNFRLSKWFLCVNDLISYVNINKQSNFVSKIILTFMMSEQKIFIFSRLDVFLGQLVGYNSTVKL